MTFTLTQLVLGAVAYGFIGIFLVMAIVAAGFGGYYVYKILKEARRSVEQHLVTRYLVKYDIDILDDVRYDLLDLAEKHGMSRKDFVAFIKDASKLRKKYEK